MSIWTLPSAAIFVTDSLTIRVVVVRGTNAKAGSTPGRVEGRTLVGDARIWNTLLFRLRKSGKLSGIETGRRTHFSWGDVDPYLFASEIAWQTMLDDGSARSLDEIFCNAL